MKDTHHRFSDEFVQDILNDDIDQLYCQLEEITPPAALVDSIMASVSHLARSQNRLSEQSPDDLTSGNWLIPGFTIQLS
jgi:hypothetical protein